LLSLHGLAIGKENHGEWLEILSRVELEGHALKHIIADKFKGTIFSQLKIVTHPDGGLSRLGVFDLSLPKSEQEKFKKINLQSMVFEEKIPQSQKPLVLPYQTTQEEINQNWSELKSGKEFDVASMLYGGKVIRVSNEHYGPVSQVLSPYEPLHMFDGFESARSRTPQHHEEFVVQLGRPAVLHRLEFDFKFFINNNPHAIKVEGLDLENQWHDISPYTEVKAFAGSKKSITVSSKNKFQQLKVFVFPDGGINRFRAFSLFKD